MKNKIKLLILSIICILLVPLSIKADGGAPITINYDIVVTNIKGTALIDYNGETSETIPYNTKLTASWEYIINDELYVDVEYNESFGYVKAADIMVLTDEIDLSKLDTFNEQFDPLFYTYSETQMYKGPSTVFGKLDDGIIPKGEVLEYEYCIGKAQDSITWIYTEYNGKKGWVYTYKPYGIMIYEYATDSTVVNYVKNSKRKIVVSFSDEEPTITTDTGEQITIKNHTEYEYEIYDIFGKYARYYIEYNGKKGWIGTSTMGQGEVQIQEINKDYEDRVIVQDQKGYNLYLSPDDEKPIENLKLPYNAELTIKGWFHVVGENDSVYNHIYIEYNNNKYWLKGENFEFDSIKQSTDIEELPDVEENSKENKLNNKDEKKLTPLQIGLICLGGALAITLTSIVIIILINKKKSAKCE